MAYIYILQVCTRWEENLFFYLMLIIVSIGIHIKLLEKKIGHSRKYISCEISGICTLVYVNQDFTDEVPFRFSIPN